MLSPWIASCLLVPAAALSVAITGTNSGIGRSAASLLIAQGHTVYHACRTAEGAQQAVAAAGGGEPMVCDLADLDSVRSFAKALGERAPTLDCLCLNSGVSPSRKAEAPERTRDGFEATVGINHLGHFCLANLLQPLLAADGGGRFVVTAITYCGYICVGYSPWLYLLWLYLLWQARRHRFRSARPRVCRWHRAGRSGHRRNAGRPERPWCTPRRRGHGGRRGDVQRRQGVPRLQAV